MPVDTHTALLPAKIETSKVFGAAYYSANGMPAGGNRAQGVISLIKDTIAP